MNIHTTCTKCGTSIQLDFGELTKEQALEFAEKLDTQPRECPGRHCELGGWKTLYQIPDAIHRAYDLDQGEPPKPIQSDKEFVETLLADGRAIVDGGRNTVPELGLDSIHNYKDLEHLGFGSFANREYIFSRIDSPRSTRFYERLDR